MIIASKQIITNCSKSYRGNEDGAVMGNREAGKALISLFEETVGRNAKSKGKFKRLEGGLEGGSEWAEMRVGLVAD